MKPILKESPGDAERYKDIGRGELQIMLFKTPGSKPEFYFSKRKKARGKSQMRKKVSGRQTFSKFQLPEKYQKGRK